ncbi:hypothetical protein NFI96_004712 [Prochilodus magdalenae]|nr:hypothetical protein NFI96_004712 [Prochilodus magdalenae]
MLEEEGWTDTPVDVVRSEAGVERSKYCLPDGDSVGGSTRYAAKDKHLLRGLNITHVLNAAHGKFSVNTGPSYYRDTNISYHGVEAFDMPAFDMSPFFYSAAKFIKSAVSTPGGKVLVHCAMGLSRSSTLVLAYLMIHENMTLVEAIKAVAEYRNICPNTGFMEQLRQLDKQLHYQGSTS